MFSAMSAAVTSDRNISPDAAAAPTPDFVVADVETACSIVGRICQIVIVGFRDGRETFAYGTMIDPAV